MAIPPLIHLSYVECTDMMVVTAEGRLLLDDYRNALDALVLTNETYISKSAVQRSPGLTHCRCNQAS